MKLIFLFFGFASAALLGLSGGSFTLDQEVLPLSGTYSQLGAPNHHVLQLPGEIVSLTGEPKVSLGEGVLALEFSPLLDQYLCVFYNGTVQTYAADWSLLSERTVNLPEPILEGVCAWNDLNGSFWLLGKEFLWRVDGEAQSIGSSADIFDLRWHNALEVLSGLGGQFAQFEGCPCEVVQPRFLGDAGSIVYRSEQQLFRGFSLLGFDEVLAELPVAAENSSSAVFSSAPRRPNLVIEASVVYYVDSFTQSPIAVDGLLEIRGGTLHLQFDEMPLDGETITLYTFAELTGQFDNIVIDTTDSCQAYEAAVAYENTQMSVTISTVSLCASALLAPVLLAISFS